MCREELRMDAGLLPPCYSAFVGFTSLWVYHEVFMTSLEESILILHIHIGKHEKGHTSSLSTLGTTSVRGPTRSTPSPAMASGRRLPWAECRLEPGSREAGGPYCSCLNKYPSCHRSIFIGVSMVSVFGDYFSL